MYNDETRFYKGFKTLYKYPLQCLIKVYRGLIGVHNECCGFSQQFLGFIAFRRLLISTLIGLVLIRIGSCKGNRGIRTGSRSSCRRRIEHQQSSDKVSSSRNMV